MKLIKLNNGNYRIVDGAASIEGSWGQIRARMLYEFEIDPKQLSKAADDMRARDNDVAEFGIGGVFIFSYSTCLERKVRAELRAIASVRKEFFKLAKVSAGAPETKQAYDRLMFLYFAQDVEGNLLLLGEDTVAHKIAA